MSTMEDALEKALIEKKAKMVGIIEELKKRFPEKASEPKKVTEPVKEEKPTVVKIADIGVGFEVKKLTDEEIVAYAAAGKQFVQDVQELARQELDVEAEFLRLKTQSPKWATFEEDNPIRQEIVRLQGRLNDLRSLDPKQRAKVEDAKFHEEIVRIQRVQPARAMMNRLADKGFIRRATFYEVRTGKANGWPDNTQFFEGIVAFPDEKHGKTPGYARAIHAEIRKMTRRVIPNEIAEMKMAGKTDLSGLLHSEVGTYFVSYDKWEDKMGKEHGPGYALVRIYFRNERKWLETEIAIGDCHWWQAEKGETQFVPVEWFEKGRVLAREKPDDERRLESMLRALMYQCRKQVEEKHLDQLIEEALPGSKEPDGSARIVPVTEKPASEKSPRKGGRKVKSVPTYEVS